MQSRILNTCRKLPWACAPKESGSETSSCPDAITQMVLRSAKAAHRSKMFRHHCFPITIYSVILSSMMPHGSRISSSTSIYILWNTDRFYQGDRDEWLFHIKAYRLKKNWTKFTWRHDFFLIGRYVLKGYPRQKALDDILELEANHLLPFVLFLSLCLMNFPNEPVTFLSLLVCSSEILKLQAKKTFVLLGHNVRS